DERQSDLLRVSAADPGDHHRRVVRGVRARLLPELERRADRGAGDVAVLPDRVTRACHGRLARQESGVLDGRRICWRGLHAGGRDAEGTASLRLARMIHEYLLRHPILSPGGAFLVRPPRRTAASTLSSSLLARSPGGLRSRPSRYGIYG